MQPVVMRLPRFETKRLILKEITLGDAPTYEKNFVDYEVIRYLSSSVPWPYPKNGIIDFITNFILPKQGKDHWVWGIFLKENLDDLIGVVDVWKDGKPENRGFWLARKYWGKGYMTEAVKPVMTFAFNELGFEKMTLANAVGNKGSRRVKEKTGSRLVRVEPAKFVDRSFTECEIWEMSKQDWQEFCLNDSSQMFELP